MKPHRIIVVVPPGLEDLAAEECRELGVGALDSQPGWLVTHGHDRLIHRLNNLARIPSRILVEVAAFHASSFSELESRLRKAGLGKAIEDRPLRVHVSVTHCRLYHTVAIKERILGILGRAPQPEEQESPASGNKLSPAGDGHPSAGHEHPSARINPPFAENDHPTADHEPLPAEHEKCLELFVRGQDDHFTLSLDSTGEHLHRRGLALHRGQAPLRENLTAALVRKVDPAGPLWDPTCGSGTILLETILSDTRWPQARYRRFAFENWPLHDAARYQSDLEKMEAEVKPLTRRLLASDIDGKELEACRFNLERAGCLERVEVFQGDVTRLQPGDILREGDILANPPYGQRVGAGEDVWRHLARWGQESALGVHLILPRGLDPKGFEKGLSFRNGGLGVATYHSYSQI